MLRTTMDYDRTDMPENYDRGRKQPDGVLDMWLERIAAAVAGHPIAAVIDLGCGTGRFTEGLARRFQASVLGVDPSERMLAQAKAKPVTAGVAFVRGSGEHIPAKESSADLIFASMSFHHFESRPQVASECRRVLRPGGHVCIRNSTRENGSPYEAYFPNYRDTLQRLPSAQEIVGAFCEGGFALRSHETVPHKMANNLSELADKAAFRADSTLQRLSEDDFAQGLANIRAAAAGSGPAMIGIDLFTFRRGRAQGWD